MKTDTLIDMLARNAGPAPRALTWQRIVPAAMIGLVTSALIAIGTLGTIPTQMYATAVPWTKLTYAAALTIAGVWLSERLSRPAASASRPQRFAAAVVLIMLMIGAIALLATPGGARLDALLGNSWLSCAWRVPVISLPALTITLWAMRGLAPTRLTAAGFAAGLLAGSLGAFGYSLSCPEASAAFVATWYTVGIGVSAALGAIAGPRVLRW
jgi:hypothetical protein